MHIVPLHTLPSPMHRTPGWVSLMPQCSVECGPTHVPLSVLKVPALQKHCAPVSESKQDFPIGQISIPLKSSHVLIPHIWSLRLSRQTSSSSGMGSPLCGVTQLKESSSIDLLHLHAFSFGLHLYRGMHLPSSHITSSPEQSMLHPPHEVLLRRSMSALSHFAMMHSKMLLDFCFSSFVL